MNNMGQFLVCQTDQYTEYQGISGYSIWIIGGLITYPSGAQLLWLGGLGGEGNWATHMHMHSTCESGGLVRTCMHAQLNLCKLSSAYVCTSASLLLVEINLCVCASPLLTQPSCK